MKAKYVLPTLLALLTLSIHSKSQVRTAYTPVYEKVYVHTDRSLYAGGETIWLSAYLVNAQTGQRSQVSNTLYTELLDASGKIAARKIIRVDNGLGKGDFGLPDSLVAGMYRLRAYTLWMRNFGDKFFFEKNIRVLSVPKPVSATGATASSTASSNRVNAETAPTTSSKIIRFFPEGGSLLKGVPGLVAIRAEDQNGNGIQAAGKLVSVSGTDISEFQCDSSGLGLVLVPAIENGRIGVSGLFTDGEKFSAELPEARATGYALQVRQTDSIVKVNIATNKTTFAADSGKTLVLLIKNKGLAVYNATFSLGGLSQGATIPTGKFPDGISAITLYNPEGKPECERLIYVGQNTQAGLAIKTDLPSYTPKSKVSLQLSTTASNGSPVSAALSLAVVDQAADGIDDKDIVSYLGLTSELRGRIEHPSRYFDRANPDRKTQLDLLLLTQGWRDFLWKRLADTASRISFPAEQGISISGNVKQLKTGRPVAASNITLWANASRGDKLFAARTDSAGLYYFDGLQLYGRQPVTLTSKNSKGENNGRMHLDLAPDPPLATPWKTPGLTPGSGPITAETTLVERRKRVATLKSDTVTLKEVELKGQNRVSLQTQQLTGFGYKDEVYTITEKDYDYRDLLYYLRHRSRATVDIVQVKLFPDDVASTPYTLLFYPGVKGERLFPRFIVNGKEVGFLEDNLNIDMIVQTQTEFLSLPLEKVKKVQIKHMLNQDLKDTYLIYLTLTPDALSPATPHTLTADVEGYAEAQAFFAPVYENPSAKPDLRTTIHWDPAVRTDPQGKASVTFYNADAKTTVRVLVQGITADGKPVAKVLSYQVR